MGLPPPPRLDPRGNDDVPEDGSVADDALAARGDDVDEQRGQRHGPLAQCCPRSRRLQCGLGDIRRVQVLRPHGIERFSLVPTVDMIHSNSPKPLRSVGPWTGARDILQNYSENMTRSILAVMLVRHLLTSAGNGQFLPDLVKYEQPCPILANIWPDLTGTGQWLAEAPGRPTNSTAKMLP